LRWFFCMLLFIGMYTKEAQIKFDHNKNTKAKACFFNIIFLLMRLKIIFF
jgi:hypothetical protein